MSEKQSLEDTTFVVESPDEIEIAKRLAKELNQLTDYDVDWFETRREHTEMISHMLEPKHGSNLLQKLSGGKLAWQKMKLATVEEWSQRFHGDLVKIARHLHEKVKPIDISVKQCLEAICVKVAPKMRGLIIGRSLVRDNERFVRASDNSDTKLKVDFGDMETGRKIQLKSGNGSQTINHFSLGESDTLAVYQEIGDGKYGIAFTDKGTPVSGNDSSKKDPAYLRAEEVDPMSDWVSGNELRAD